MKKQKKLGGNEMNLTDSKAKLAVGGALCGVVAVLLAIFGNPGNMAICIACFIRDTAGALGMHQAAVVQYARPAIIGIVLGAFIISVVTKEYRSTAGSSPMIRFVLGIIIKMCIRDRNIAAVSSERSYHVSFSTSFQRSSMRFKFYSEI